MVSNLYGENMQTAKKLSSESRSAEPFKYARQRRARGKSTNLNIPVSSFVETYFNSQMKNIGSDTSEKSEGHGSRKERSSSSNPLFNVEGQETFTVYRPTSVPSCGIPLKAKSTRQVYRALLWPTNNLRVGEWFIVQSTPSQLNALRARLNPGSLTAGRCSIRIDRENSLVAVHRTA